MVWPFNKKAQVETKASIGEQHYVVNGSAQYSMHDFRSYAEEGYGCNPTIYRCISLIAQNFAKVPLYLKDKNGEIVEEHPIVDLLKRPNPDEGGVEFRTAGASWYLLTGNTFSEIIKEGDTAHLWHYQPYDISITGRGPMPASYYFMKGKPNQKQWDVEPTSGHSTMLHWRTFNPAPSSPRFGQAPLQAGAKAGDTYNAGTDWRFSALKNGGSAGGLVTVEGIDDPQRKQLDEIIRQSMSGSSNAKRIVSINADAKFQQIGMNMKDADWLAGSKLNAQEIASVFGVPTQMLGIEGSQTFANYEQARMSFWVDTVMPMLDLYVSELTRWLMPAFEVEGYEICYNTEDIEALEPQRKERRTELLDTEVLTLNEKREVIGYEPIDEPEADQIFVDPSRIPLGLDVFSTEEAQEQDLAKALIRGGLSKEDAEQKAFEIMAERKSVRKDS